MSRPGKAPSWLPTPRQELLLRACLLPADPALEAWREWRASVDLNRLDAGSYRLLPLLHRNLSDLGVNDPLMNTFRGVRRMTWYRNQILFDQALPLLNALQRADIEAVLLKGAALALLHYRDAGLRPMADVDVMVPAQRAAEAVAILFDAGWTPAPTPLKAFPAGSRLAGTGWGPPARARDAFTGSYFAVRHSHEFKNPRGGSIDLHWRLLAGSHLGGNGEDFPLNTVPAEFRGIPVLALDASGQLLHVAAHGARFDPVPPVRWAADAVTVVNTPGGGIDWERLPAEAERHGLSPRISAVMDYLAKRLELPVPPTVLEDLRKTPATGAQRLRQWAAARPPGLLEGCLELAFLRHCYRELTSSGVLSDGEMTFPAFLKHILGMSRVGQIPLYALLEVARRAWIRLAR